MFWDMTPCSPLKVNRRFRGTCRLHLQGRRISQERKQLEAGGSIILRITIPTQETASPLTTDKLMKDATHGSRTYL
jgi:hypothetical protein